jgi:hypothetical protein
MLCTSQGTGGDQKIPTCSGFFLPTDSSVACDGTLVPLERGLSVVAMRGGQRGSALLGAAVAKQFEGFGTKKFRGQVGCLVASRLPYPL